MNTYSRRRFLIQSVSALVAGSWASSALASIDDSACSSMFAHGVASGDPSNDSVVLWTRVSPPKGQHKNVTVHWQIAADMGFTQVHASGKTSTNNERDYTVKVDASSLRPGQRYFYRFLCGKQYSQTGRTWCLPKADIESLCLAVASCSNFPFGYFNAYREIALDDEIDFTVHLGDYIYEYGDDEWGADSGRAMGRQHEPAHEIVSLGDYRQRHAQYKTDRFSQLMHASCPTILLWDDHESANNPYRHGAQNHQTVEGEWIKRREASLQAYFEWMPIRDPKLDGDRAEYWRHYEFGQLASLISLETRHTGRHKQVDYAEHLSTITTPQQRQEFVDDVLNDASRKMLDAQQQQFYSAEMKLAGAKKWRLIGNQIPLARTYVPPLELLFADGLIPDKHAMFSAGQEYIRLSELNLPLYTDTWDGYPAAREEFYAMNSRLGVNDLLVLTGDSHSFWANRLFDGDGQAMGVELGTAGITSPGDFEMYDAALATKIDEALADHNDEVVWTDGLHRGFIKLSLNSETADVEFKTVSTVKSEDYQVATLREMTIIKRQDTLQLD